MSTTPVDDRVLQLGEHLTQDFALSLPSLPAHLLQRPALVLANPGRRCRSSARPRLRQRRRRSVSRSRRAEPT